MVKRLTILGIWVLLATACSGRQPVFDEVEYCNPILHMDFSDPDVCRVGEDYYMTASSFNCFPGLPILHSRDLVHWEQIGAALTDYPGENWFTVPGREDTPDGAMDPVLGKTTAVGKSGSADPVLGKTTAVGKSGSADPVWGKTGSAHPASADDFRTTVQHGNAVWAPAIRYHDGWFYIFVGDPDRGIFMVKTQDPAGRWEAPVWVVRQKGFIDPCPLWGDDGRAWLSHGLAGSRAGLKSVLFVAPMAPDGRSLLGPSRIVYDGHQTQPTIEGTKFYKRNGWYYIFSPAGGVATGWQTVLRAREPFGPYEERIVMAWAPGTINGPHQGAWVEGPDSACGADSYNRSHSSGSSDNSDVSNGSGSRDWFIHFQDKGAYGRIVHLQPLKWRDDGWPLIGEDPDGDGVGQPVASGVVRVPAVSERKCAAPGSEKEGRCCQQRHTPAPVHENGLCGVPSGAPGPYGLSYAWQYPAVPGPYWHMALPEGGVRLYSVEQSWPYTSLWDCPNVLQQKFPAESFTVTALLRFCPNPQLKQKGETAGFVVMGNDYAGLRITDTAQGAELCWIQCPGASKGAEETARNLCTLPYTAHPQPHQYASGNVPPVNYPDRQEARLWVKLEVSPKPVEGNVPDAVCHFSYSLDGENWTAAGQEFLARPELWVGAKWGFFCNRFSSKNDAGWLDIQIQ